MMKNHLPRVPYPWKGGIGLTVLAALLFSGGMQVQAWRDAYIPAALTTACDRRITMLRDNYSKQAAERDKTVQQVKGIADQISEIAGEIKADVKSIQDTLKKRAPVTDKIARKVDVIDNKATSAVAAAREARTEAAKAAQATQANAPVPAKAISKINRSVEEVNRK